MPCGYNHCFLKVLDHSRPNEKDDSAESVLGQKMNLSMLRISVLHPMHRQNSLDNTGSWAGYGVKWLFDTAK